MLETYVKTRIAVESFVRRQAELATSSEYRWVWLVLIGILVVAAAVAWVYCRNAGLPRFHRRHPGRPRGGDQDRRQARLLLTPGR